MADDRKLNVVDEGGRVIGEETREDVHQRGLLHREVHVWLYTPNGAVIFQRRGKEKDTHPGLLDATVGGHVEIGSDYDRAALQEFEEETGIRAAKDHLVFLRMVRRKTRDDVTGLTNNVIRAVYAYRYDGNVEDLRVEEGRAMGFEAWPRERMFNISDEDRKRLIPSLIEEEVLGIFRAIQTV